MTTTILTDEQINEIDPDGLREGFARAIEQAVLQSPEVQAWKRDAERYRWLRDIANPADWEFISHQSPDVVDVEVNAAMEKQR